MSARAFFEDTFQINSLDNSKFERVSRIKCKSQGFETTMILDVNTDIYPLAADSVLISDKATEADNYEYVMHGKIFKIEEKDKLSTVYISYGGLLMALTGEKRDVSELQLDSRVFLLVRKAGDVAM